MSLELKQLFSPRAVDCLRKSHTFAAICIGGNKLIVRCSEKALNDFTQDGPANQYYTALPLLELGKDYVVYAVYASECLSFFIDLGSYLPGHYPASLFEVIDPRPSKYWALGHYTSNNEYLTILSYPEWALNYHEFWRKFVDGDRRTRDQYYEFKKLMDDEYIFPIVKSHATIIENSWVECSKCLNIWEASDKFELITCPDCNEKLINDLAVSRNSGYRGNNI